MLNCAPIFGCSVLGQAIDLASSPNLDPYFFPRVGHEIMHPFLNLVNKRLLLGILFATQEPFWRRRSRAARRIAVQPESFRRFLGQRIDLEFSRAHSPARDTSCEPEKARMYINHCSRFTTGLLGADFTTVAFLSTKQNDGMGNGIFYGSCCSERLWFAEF